MDPRLLRLIKEFQGAVQFAVDAVELESGSIDFDFGDRGEIDGFDWWRLWQFARERTSQYDFASRTEIESAFAAAAKLGQVVRRGSLYYLAE